MSGQKTAAGSQKRTTLVVGLGLTGLSVLRFLYANGDALCVVDSREAPPGLQTLEQEMPDVKKHLGGFDGINIDKFDLAVVSPGVALSEPRVQAVKQSRIKVCGDVELFAAQIDCPVIAVTGSNGKSTVTALLGAMVNHCGLRVAVGGNIGVPVLDLLKGGPYDACILELSSFQLETTSSLRPVAATILNVSPDHMDRYRHYDDYIHAKERVLKGDGLKVLPWSFPLPDEYAGGNVVRFSLSTPVGDDFGVRSCAGRAYLARGEKLLLPVDTMPLRGGHNILNALAALALATALDLDLKKACEAIASFRGLPHRMQLVLEHNQIQWIDDSKATNPGATVAALSGLDRQVILIAGGQSKGADMTALTTASQGRLRMAIVLGQDADKVRDVLMSECEVHEVATMDAAVDCASQHAQAGDVVLLSPACASLDMFANYAERGMAFASAVKRMVA